MTTTKLKALIVEDNPSDAVLLKRILQRLPMWQVEIKVAETEIEALEAFQTFSPDVVFVDYLLALNTGTNVIRRLIHIGNHTAFILLTGYGDETVVTDALRSGATDYLTKHELSPGVLDRTLRHVVERKKTEKQLHHNAFHDGLTDLPNRALFIERLHQAIRRTKRHEDYQFAVLFLDLDRFKVINDSLGHSIGDKLLIEITHRLKECVRGEDTFARLGGDEFTILLDGIRDISDATRVADRIQEKLQPPFCLDGHDVYTTASIGIALSETGYERPDDVMRDADMAMYRAKSSGKARYEVFDREMHTQAVTRLKLETELRRALEKREFVVFYQPIVSMETGKIVAFEALLRWNHPERGYLLPKTFIPLAEETGTIISLDRWVLNEACRQTSGWRSEFSQYADLTINVNLSGKQFTQPDLTRHIDQITSDTGFSNACLNLEITEGVIIRNAELAAEVLCELKRRDIQLQMDDFGAGYSPLSYLHQFPIDTLKIDRSLCNGSRNNKSSLMLEGIIGLARSLNMGVTAEGLETASQVSRVKSLECDYGQGYFFSEPLNCDDATAMLAADPHWQ